MPGVEVPVGLVLWGSDLCLSLSAEIRIMMCCGAFLKQEANFRKPRGFIGEGDSSAKAPDCISAAFLTDKEYPDQIAFISCSSSQCLLPSVHTV